MILWRYDTTIATVSPSRRRGVVLVWFAIFLFVLLPLMTLIVRNGMVSLSRRQMQTAVNTAAVEGVRFRDDSLTEQERRENVNSLVASLYDDSSIALFCSSF